MRFKGLDLNLLVALDALLTEKNVSAAARRIHLSQPAMSGALARLRAHFNDDLLVQVRRRMVLTHFAESIAEPIHNLMAHIDKTLGVEKGFDPETSQRTFTLAASDHIAEELFTRVVQKVAALAPQVVLDITQPRGGELLENGEVDLQIIMPNFISPQHPAELLYEEDHVVLGWSGNRALDKPLTIEDFLSFGHVAHRLGFERRLAFAEAEMNQRLPVRRVEVFAPTFVAIPRLLISTNRIAVVHKRLAEMAAQTLPLVIQPLPFDLPKMRVMIQHHSLKSSDNGVQWLKSVIRDCV
ncbi:LysR family transcriptional regulator [Phenylobacterium immobile]|uniref:LysR family transcriptional regulator n=1 Tax=Phenylobacterium immobile TaxID=21 RepID=UPI000A5DDEF7|nr:LysR family transcriptional regulator [Phenylobacterium immobile]